MGYRLFQDPFLLYTARKYEDLRLFGSNKPGEVMIPQSGRTESIFNRSAAWCARSRFL